MPEARVNGIRLHYEERGEGRPIACIHGTGSSASVWRGAVEELSRHARVIAYDRRGHARSERPDPYERTTAAEHADDAAALLHELGATPAVVIGRSYGGGVALDLALRHSDTVHALVLLEAVPHGLSSGADEWVRALNERLRGVAAQAGVDAVGNAMISGVLGEDAWSAFPEELRRTFTQNGAAILAEAVGGELETDAATLAKIDRSVLLVAAADSPPEFRAVTEAMADAIPGARTALVSGGHLIDPASPEVLGFVREVLEADSA